MSLKEAEHLSYLFVLVCGDSNKLRLREGLTAYHFLNTANFYDVNTGLIFVQGVQHYLSM